MRALLAGIIGNTVRDSVGVYDSGKQLPLLYFRLLWLVFLKCYVCAITEKTKTRAILWFSLKTNRK